MKKFSYFLRKLTLGCVEDWITLFGGIAIVTLMMLTVVDVSGRYLFSHPLMGGIEISELLLLVIVILPMASTQRVGGHLGVDLLLNKFKGIKHPLYPAFQIITLFISETVFIFVLYYCFKDFLTSLAINETTEGPLFIISWPAKGILSLGLLFLCVRLAIQLSEAVKSIRWWGK